LPPASRNKRVKKKSKHGISKGRADRKLFSVIIGLVLFGSIMIFSGSVPIASAQELEPYYYFVNHIQFIILGFIVFLVTYNLDYHHYPKIIIPALIVTFILLVLVLFTPEINYTHRWLDLKFIRFQVSDVAKLTITIYLASWLSQNHTKKYVQKNVKSYVIYNLIPFLSILGVFSLLIILQPDLSTTALIGMTALAIYFISGTDALHTIGTIGITITLALAGVVAGLLAPYRFERISGFFNFISTGELSEPFGRDYQLRQILIAVGTGKITGQGFAQSKQKFSYLTDTAFSDTIFAVFAEEFGFLGSFVLISVFIWIMFRGFKIAREAPDRLGSLIASGITIWLTLQAFIHFAVNVGLIPLTGIPLPFVSYGGSSLIVSMAAIGILLNISRYTGEEFK